MALRALASVNVAAVERNVARLGQAAGDAQVCAVVKADGYGHGMLPCARAALAGGATWLAVATADEARELRAGVGADVPILVLGALGPEELDVALGAGADVTAWTEDFVAGLVARGARAGVHVKLDTGLGRLGTRDPAEADRVADAVAAADGLRLVAGWTHLATADERGDTFFGDQLARFRAWGGPLRERHPGVLLHAANSAAVLRNAGSSFDLVRCGVAIYGLDPFGRDVAVHRLEPALRLTSAVAAVKTAAAGESAGYGRRWVAEADTVLATVPIGYGDGWRRGLSAGSDVLIGGRRAPLAGTVSMDNITVVAPHARVGDEVVLLGVQGDERVSAEEIAFRLDTINYEITCGISARVPRRHHRDGEPLGR